MVKSSPAFKVESFEFVDAAPGLALLRLSGTWRDGTAPDGVTLVAVAGGQRLALELLPAPPATDGAWRAAASTSPEMLHDQTVWFELAFPEGEAIVLPMPVEHGVDAQERAPAPESALEPLTDPIDTEPQAPKSRFFSRRRAMEPAPDPHLEQLDPLAVERDARHSAERLASEQRARAERAEALLSDELRGAVGKTERLIEKIDGYERLRRELDATRSELDAANAHLDTLHDAHSLELRAARTQRDQAEERRVATEETLAETRAAVETLRAHLDDREALIARARADAAEAGAELDEVQTATTRLRDAITTRAREVATSQRRFERTPEALTPSREELAREAERIAALERQAEALRDAIHSQLAYSLHASPLQEVLPLAAEEEHEPEAQSEA